MDRQRWRRLKALVVGALELEEDERPDWLRAAADGDQALCDEALRLLAKDEASRELEPDASADWIVDWIVD